MRVLKFIGGLLILVSGFGCAAAQFYLGYEPISCMGCGVMLAIGGIMIHSAICNYRF
jgi:hypothetical protein